MNYRHITNVTYFLHRHQYKAATKCRKTKSKAALLVITTQCFSMVLMTTVTVGNGSGIVELYAIEKCFLLLSNMQYLNSR